MRRIPGIKDVEAAVKADSVFRSSGAGGLTG
jgi:hypothetical protein